MANSLASLVPVLIEQNGVPFLRRRGGLVNRIYSTRQQAISSRGGNTVTVTMPAAPVDPQILVPGTSNAPQDIVLPSAQLTFNRHFERKISLNDLEARIAQGGQDVVLQNTITGMMDDLLIKVEKDIGSLWTNLPIVGANNKRLDDPTMRAALQILEVNRVQPTRELVSFRGTSLQYTRDLLGIPTYVLALNTGQGAGGQYQDNPIITGRIPTLYNMNADWSHAMPSQTFSGAGTEVGMLFEQHFAAVGFLEFQPAKVLSNGAAAVTETFTKDPESGITIRWQTYMDIGAHTMYLQADVCYGYTILDPTRGVTILSATA